MRRIHVLFFIAAMFSSSSTLRAQDSVHEQLFQMMLLEQDGQFSKVIETVPLLLKSTALSQGERGRGWVLLGAAQQTHGDFLQAQIAYDHALQIFSGDHALVDDYAATLENYAGLYRDLWQSQLAIRMERKALTIYESQNNHARLARSCAMLGELELNLDERRKAHDYLFRALNEAKLAGETDGDLVASITSTQAWLSLKDGHSQAAISASEHAVELWRKQHGEEHYLTGWGLVLVGKAYAQAGQDFNALVNMRNGLKILSHTVGETNPQFLVAEAAYSKILDHAGKHLEASSLKEASERALARLYQGQCVGCSISVAALR